MTLEQMRQVPQQRQAEQYPLTRSQQQQELRESMQANNYLQQASKAMQDKMRELKAG